MDPNRFDRVAKFFAERRLSRRKVVAVGATVAATTLAGTSASAQEATPVGSPDAAPVTWEKTPYLFVQSFRSGTLEPTADPDVHTLTLEQGLGQTVYFADRPSRDVGVSPTGQFLDTLGFSEENPPNAALVVDSGDGETEIAVVELFDPTYDESTHTATYQVKSLEAWESSEETGFHDTPADLSTLAGDLGVSHLLIDDCPNDTISCSAPYYGDVRQTVGTFDNQGFCYDYLLCIPCEPYGHNPPYRGAVVDYWSQKCNDTYSACNGQCIGDFTNRCALDGC